MCEVLCDWMCVTVCYRIPKPEDLSSMLDRRRENLGTGESDAAECSDGGDPRGRTKLMLNW